MHSVPNVYKLYKLLTYVYKNKLIVWVMEPKNRICIYIYKHKWYIKQFSFVYDTTLNSSKRVGR